MLIRIGCELPTYCILQRFGGKRVFFLHDSCKKNQKHMMSNIPKYVKCSFFFTPHFGLFRDACGREWGGKSATCWPRCRLVPLERENEWQSMRIVCWNCRPKNPAMSVIKKRDSLQFSTYLSSYACYMLQNPFAVGFLNNIWSIVYIFPGKIQ